MRDYLFTLKSPSGLEQLYRMGQFPDSEHAFCLAELMAAELNIDENRSWHGWTIDVRDSKASLVFSVPVGHGDNLYMTNGALAENRSRQLAAPIHRSVRIGG